MLEFIKTNYEWIISGCSLAVTAVYAVIYYVKRCKALKGAKTNEERTAIINDIKARTYGFISVAEELFSDVPKSGASKLLYVLNNVKNLCTDSGIEFDKNVWEKFINDIVSGSNEIIDVKKTEQQNADFIEKVKKEVPYMVDEANRLFANIPDSTIYKIEYIVKGIEILCKNLTVNVFDFYDWQTYVASTYFSKVDKGA